MTWTTVTLQVTTPLFNGGADPGGAGGFRPEREAGLRVASVRGAMRFWFRALAGTVVGPDLDLLGRLERRVFGGVGAKAGKTVPSPLILRLSEPPALSSEPVPAFLAAPDGRWIGYLLGLGLMKLERGKPRLTRPFLPPGPAPVELKMRFRHAVGGTNEIVQAVEALAFASLWLVCTYGGIGARTRRGFGGMRITEVAGDVPPPWRNAWLRTPDPAFYRPADWLWPWGKLVFEAFEKHLRTLIAGEKWEGGPVDGWAEPPPYPVLSRKYSPAAVVKPTRTRPEFGSWEKALGYGGKQLRLFRANRPFEESERSQGRVRTAEWDEVIHGDLADFPLGALGLPVGFHDKLRDHKFMVNAEGTQDGGGELRRASPLWLRPVGADSSWQLFTFAFRTSFLPDQVKVRLLPDEKARHDGHTADDLFVEQADVDRLTTQWIAVMRSGGNFVTTIRD
jgi:hypothetical protein